MVKPVPEDAVDEALALAAEGPAPAEAKKPKRERPKGSKYADYAPGVFRKHPAARALNTVLDLRFPADDGAPSAGMVELGEALTAAAHWALGLPPTSPRDGDGHPYLVAAERTHRFATPRVLKSSRFRALFDRLRGRSA